MGDIKDIKDIKEIMERPRERVLSLNAALA